jgi:hypothetical protein
VYKSVRTVWFRTSSLGKYKHRTNCRNVENRTHPPSETTPYFQLIPQTPQGGRVGETAELERSYYIADSAPHAERTLSKTN